MDPGSVMLGYVHAGTVRAEFMSSVLAVTSGPSRDPRISAVVGETAGSLIAKARNQLAARFLASAAEWLWQVDTDVVFSKGALGGLLAAADPAERPVVSGVVHILRADGSRVPSLHYIDGPRTAFRFIQIRGLPADSVTIEVGACGAACLLVHRAVFEKLGGGWFDPVPVPGLGLVGDDWSFCLRLRSAGIPVHAVTGVQAGHIKPVMIGWVVP